MGFLRTARSWATATVDTVVIFVAMVALLFPVTSALGAAVGFPSGWADAVTGIVAFGATYPFVAGAWSIGTLGEYFFAFVATTLVLLGTEGVLLATGTVGIPVKDPIVRLGVWCVVYTTAYMAVASGATRRVLSR